MFSGAFLMADDEQQASDANGFFISNLTATTTTGFIIFLGVVILYQNYQLGLAVDTIGLIHNSNQELKAKIK